MIYEKKTPVLNVKWEWDVCKGMILKRPSVSDISVIALLLTETDMLGQRHMRRRNLQITLQQVSDETETKTYYCIIFNGKEEMNIKWTIN